METNRGTERLEALIKEIIDDWYIYMEEYPKLHEYMAASLVKTGLVAETAGPGGERAGR